MTAETKLSSSLAMTDTRLLKNVKILNEMCPAVQAQGEIGRQVANRLIKNASSGSSCLHEC